MNDKSSGQIQDTSGSLGAIQEVDEQGKFKIYTFRSVFIVRY